MKLPVLAESEERQDLFSRPHLSYSRIAKFLTCPEQYRLYYVEGFRPRVPSANLVFGQVLHQSLAVLLSKGTDPVIRFEEQWNTLQAAELDYSYRDSWERLRDCGVRLLERFRQEELPHLSQVEAVEKPFSLDITSLDLPFVGIIDLVATYMGKRTVIDFKTAANPYKLYEAQLSDQLTAYQLAEPNAEQSAICVLVKTREPVIEWHVVKRTGDDMDEYLAKIGWTSQSIQDGQFHKRVGFWCTWCDFLPVCLGDKRRAKETLIQLQ